MHRIRANGHIGECVLAVAVGRLSRHDRVAGIDQLNGHARQPRLTRFLRVVAVAVDVDRAGQGRRGGNDRDLCRAGQDLARGHDHGVVDILDAGTRGQNRVLTGRELRVKFTAPGAVAVTSMRSSTRADPPSGW